MIRIFTIFCALLAAAATMAAGGKRGLTADDYGAIELPGDPSISPDGKTVAYTISTVDAKRNTKHSTIWLVPMDGSREPRQLTTGESAKSPRWSRDGRILAFISSRRDPASPATATPKAQVYGLPMTGGEARRLTDLKNGVTAFTWSPDGTKLACVSRTEPSAGAAEKSTSDVRHYFNPLYKADGTGFLDNRRGHVWIVDVRSGAAKQVTFGDQRNDADPVWSPNGARIAFVSQRTDTTTGMRNEDLFVANADGSSPTKISDHDVGIHAPRWSPDGRRLAYIASENEIAIPKIFISAATGGASKPASDTVTYATELEWTHDGKGFYYTAASKGEHPVFRLDLASRESTALTERVTVRQLDVDEERSAVAYAAGDDTHPGDLFALADGARTPRRLTHMNAKLLDATALSPMERLRYKAADGWDVEGFFIKPVDLQEGRSYPMILMIHGGPNGMWGFQWNLEVQAFAAHGWAVLLTNPRGSSGYGEAFQRGVDKEWGGKAYQDIMSGVDAALAKYPWIDKNRLGVSGHSYGGFMTDWIVGHTDRFKAAVTLAGISDFVSVEGTRDGYYGHARDFGGDLFENFDLYWKYSPVRYAKDVKTPTLILHGDSDHRVPLEQGEQFFRALRHFNVTSEFVIFPREGHSLRNEPKHAIELAKWQLYWFERFVEGNAKAARPNGD
jgi:dipeptidyl aminopeptidase/acylaminoacyl peptidase